MDEVYRRIPDPERQVLPNETGPYINALVAFALNHLDQFGEATAQMIAGVYIQSPGAERFIRDPIRSDEITESILLLDGDGHLVTVRNPELEREGATRDSIGQLSIKLYQ